MKKSLLILILLLNLGLALSAQTKDPPFSTVTAAGVTFNYRLSDLNQNLECQLIAATTGWVAVGFDPTVGMQNANIIIGYHQDGSTFTRDDFGTGIGTHASDVSLGGTSDIVFIASTEVADTTRLFIKIPLNSGDAFDKVLVFNQTYTVALGLALNGGDSFTAPHAAFATAQITIPAPVGNADDGISILPFALSAYPNPFQAETNLTFKLNKTAEVSIRLYDTRGRLVRTLPSTSFSQGENQLILSAIDDNGNALPGGIYYLKVSASGMTAVKKLLLLR
jgi:hypothetical protein